MKLREQARACLLLAHPFFLVPTTSERLLRRLFNPFAPGDFAEKRVLKLVEWFSGHCPAIKEALPGGLPCRSSEF